MKKLSKFSLIGGILLFLISLLSLFGGRTTWVVLNGISFVIMGILIAGIGGFMYFNPNTPQGHRSAWAGIGVGTLLYTIGGVFRLFMAGKTGQAGVIFTATDYITMIGYAGLVAGYYFFMTRAGNVIDEIDKLKIIWGIGIFILLVLALYIAMQATEIFGNKTTMGMIANIYYEALDIIIILIGITYLVAYHDGEIKKFFQLLALSMFLWTITDLMFILRGSYGKQTSFILTLSKLLAGLFFIIAYKNYVSVLYRD